MFCIQQVVVISKEWWTGEDSNLRSPQGAADLQSAGFSHSPTRPVVYGTSEVLPAEKTQ